MLRKRLRRCPSGCFIYFFHRKSLLFTMYCRCWSGRMWPKYSYVHTRIFQNCYAPPRDGWCCNAFVGFHKTYQEVLVFSEVLSFFNILFKMTYNRFLDLGILKAPFGPDDVLDVIVSIIPEQKLLPCLPRTSLSLCSYRTMFGLSDRL